MWKPILTLAAIGVGGVVLWQVIWAVLVPVLGAVLGLLLTVLKVGLLVLLAYWIYRMAVNGSKNRQQAEN